MLLSDCRSGFEMNRRDRLAARSFRLIHTHIGEKDGELLNALSIYGTSHYQQPRISTALGGLIARRHVFNLRLVVEQLDGPGIAIDADPLAVTDRRRRVSH